jgi:GTP-binding protein EngB required for normal cell division
MTSKKAVSLVENRGKRLGSMNHCHRQGRTKTLNFYRVGDPGQLVLVDAPGYGARGRVEWGKLFDEYIENREQYAFPSNCVAPNPMSLFFI